MTASLTQAASHPAVMSAQSFQTPAQLLILIGVPSADPNRRARAGLAEEGRLALGLVLYRVGGMDLLPLCTLIEMKLPVIRTADDISTAPDSLGYCVERCDLDNDAAAMNNMFTYDDLSTMAALEQA